MIKQTLILTSITAGWMLSADALVQLGNGVGTNSTLYLAALALTALSMALAIWIIRHPSLRKNGQASLTGILVQGAGRLPAMTLLIVSRLSLAIILPVGILVTAGFAFNEIFVYWFPNFGFSFILLAFISLLHLVNERLARSFQPLFVIPIFILFVILCLAGMTRLGGTPISVDTGFTLSGAALITPFIIFLGWDYISPEHYQESRIPAFAALFFTLIIFLFWSMLSIQGVSPEKLSNSTIPYMLTAKALLGQYGRVIMGIIVILGSCALVNMVFLMVSSTFKELVKRNLLPGHPPVELKRRRFIVILAATIGVLLITGLAGYEILETYIKATLILWLFLSGMQCLAAARLLRNERNLTFTGYGLALIYISISVLLVITDPATFIICRFLGSMIILTAAVSFYWLKKGPVIEVLEPTNKEIPHE